MDVPKHPSIHLSIHPRILIHPTSEGGHAECGAMELVVSSFAKVERESAFLFQSGWVTLTVPPSIFHSKFLSFFRSFYHMYVCMYVSIYVYTWQMNLPSLYVQYIIRHMHTWAPSGWGGGSRRREEHYPIWTHDWSAPLPLPPNPEEFPLPAWPGPTRAIP